MKVLLVNVALRPGSPLKLFPTGLAYVASAVVRAGFDLEILDIDSKRYSDEELERLIESRDFDVVATGCIVTGYKFVKNLAAIVRRKNRDAVIIVGNSVGASIPEILLAKTEVDIVVMGEGDVTIVDLLRHLSDKKSLDDVQGICYKQAGRIVFNPLRPVIEDINRIPHPRWDLFDMETYIDGGRVMVSDPLPMPREEIRPFQVNTARGCLYQCTFCYHQFRGLKYRHRSASSIIAEMKELKSKYDINYIHFWDELTFFSLSQASEIVEALLEADLALYWTADVRGNMFKDEAGLVLAKKMKRSGCIGLGYSLESANAEILKAMDKKITPEQFVTQKRILDKAGLASWTSLVFGYPAETRETIRQTFDCCREAGIYPSAGYLLPQPGTPMYEYAKQKGHIADEEEYLLRLGDRQDLRLNLTGMTDSEFESYIQEGLKDLNRYLETGLAEDNLIKTMFYRQKRREDAPDRVAGS